MGVDLPPLLAAVTETEYVFALASPRNTTWRRSGPEPGTTCALTNSLAFLIVMMYLWMGKSRPPMKSGGLHDTRIRPEVGDSASTFVTGPGAAPRTKSFNAAVVTAPAAATR
jgi:hypothetical protein